ncbi:MAG: energy-coupling factor transporter ATPase [Defluviitaleaceae bacterium]|nr:energy-coupling factor transporter ATPase [Defluviitaleaceae bacterium]
MKIEIKDLSFVYSKGTAFEKTALNHINISIVKGEFIGLIGHTGSGKSTLIQHMNSLLKPTSGHIFIDGEDINIDKSRLKAIRSKVGLVFQYPEHQLFEMTVFKDVAFGPSNSGLSEQEIKERVVSSLEIVGISEDNYQKSPFELSGGQKRRVAIAGVLAMRPEVLILDEPAAGLDPRGRDEILGRIKEMHKKLGLTVVLVSHSMEDIAKLVSRIIVINKGQIVMTQTPAEIFENPEILESMGLSAPQTSYVIKALRARGFDLPKGIYTVDAAVEAIFANLKGLKNE